MKVSIAFSGALSGASALALAAALSFATPAAAQQTGAGVMNSNMTTAPAGTPGTTEQPSANTGANASTDGSVTTHHHHHHHHHHHATAASSTSAGGSMSNSTMSGPTNAGANPNGSIPGTNSTTNPGGAPNSPAGAATPH